MNYYCLYRLIEEGYSYLDFVECYTDFTGGIYIYPIGSGLDDMMFLGYSRRIS